MYLTGIGGSGPPRGRGSFRCFQFRWLNGVFLNRNVFESCMKNDNISVRTVYRWLFEDIVRFEVGGGVYEKYAKM